MSSTTFVDQQSIIYASWLNDVNTVAYTTVPGLSSTVAAIPSTYLTQASAASTYLTQASASSTYGKLATTNTWALAQTFTSGIVGNVTGNATNVTGTVAVANGGTGGTTTSTARTNLGVAIGTDVLGYVAPGTSGNVLTSNGTSWQSSSPSTSGGLVLLGTLVTTSGASVSLTGLSLTAYSQLFIVFNNVSSSSIANFLINSVLFTDTTGTVTDSVWGTGFINLATSTFSSTTGQRAGTTGTFSVTGTATETVIGNNGITTATTTITVTPSAGNFDTGSILVYGVK